MEEVTLLPDDIYASGYEKTSRPGSVINADYDSGRYIVVDIDNHEIELYDLWAGALTTDIGYGLDPFIQGDYVTYFSSDINSYRIMLYCISTGILKDITPDGYSASSPAFSEDGRFISFAGIQIDTQDVFDPAECFVYSIEKDESKIVAHSYSDILNFTYEAWWAGNKLLFKGEEETVHGPEYDYLHYPYKLYDPETDTVSYFAYHEIFNGSGPSYIRATDEWIAYEIVEGEGVFLLNKNTGELKHILQYPERGYGIMSYVKVFFPEISGKWVVWVDYGDFYAYNIETVETIKLSSNPKDRVGSEVIMEDDQRYYWRNIIVIMVWLYLPEETRQRKS
jgi:tricorn protease-like protein